MNMEHKKYPSIENSYREKALEQIRKYVPSNEKWIVQEKLHGANLQIQTDGNTVKFGSRNLMLNTFTELEQFNRLDTIAENLSFAAIEMYHDLKEMSYLQEGNDLIIYGELCGGSYPHEDVPAVDTPMVQKGVFYGPGLYFFAFDVYIKNSEESGHYLWSDTFDSLIRKYFNHTRILFTGTLDECLQFPNDGQTTIPAEFNLPEIEDNIMEGVVIKPVSCARPRFMLKNKNERFTEKQQRSKRDKTPQVISSNLQEAMDTLGQYINENRLDAVLSKHGQPLEGKVIGQTIGELTKDALEDMEKDDSEILQTLEKGERKTLNKYGSSLSRKLILAKV